MSHSGNFIHFIVPLNYKSKQNTIKGKLGKPLLDGWGGLFRGRKNKGTSGTFSPAELLSSTYPGKPHLS